KAMNTISPACVNMPTPNLTNFSDATLLPQQRQCFCGIPEGNAWYKSCLDPNVYAPSQHGDMDDIAKLLMALKSNITCSASAAGAGPSSKSIDTVTAAEMVVIAAVATLLNALL
ncbi:hypothetical protein BGX29_008437, partial [Mortierella sp. GBA35]